MITKQIINQLELRALLNSNSTQKDRHVIYHYLGRIVLVDLFEAFYKFTLGGAEQFQ